MLARTPVVDTAVFEKETGWQIKPEGACKGDVCIPLPNPPGATLDLVATAEAMGLPVVHDDEHGLIAVGPESLGNRALVSAEAPELNLPDLNGKTFALSSLRGQKIIVYAWAPY
jgi:hypothetical protein